MPKWLTFLITMAAAHGLVSLGIVLLMRGGVVSVRPGHGVRRRRLRGGAAYNKLGVTDALRLALAGGVTAASLIARRSRRCWRATAASSSPC